jgi:Asp-tRNA(Asn)/Glu-tRNA(Gln) amidotransferase C subunit
MQEITREFIRTLAAANGITIPDERLEQVRRQYESFLRTLEEIDAVALAPETEPATAFLLASPVPPPAASRR